MNERKKAGVTQFDLRKETTKNGNKLLKFVLLLQGKWRKFSCQIFPFKRIYTAEQ
jgi:hypothetical protein